MRGRETRAQQECPCLASQKQRLENVLENGVNSNFASPYPSPLPKEREPVTCIGRSCAVAGPCADRCQSRPSENSVHRPLLCCSEAYGLFGRCQKTPSLGAFPPGGLCSRLVLQPAFGCFRLRLLRGNSCSMTPFYERSTRAGTVSGLFPSKAKEIREKSKSFKSIPDRKFGLKSC